MDQAFPLYPKKKCFLFLFGIEGLGKEKKIKEGKRSFLQTCPYWGVQGDLPLRCGAATKGEARFLRLSLSSCRAAPVYQIGMRTLLYQFGMYKTT